MVTGQGSFPHHHRTDSRGREEKKTKGEEGEEEEDDTVTHVLRAHSKHTLLHRSNGLEVGPVAESDGRVVWSRRVGRGGRREGAHG